jgi:hypothetical protein
MDSTGPLLTYTLTASPIAACFEGQSSLIDSTQGSCCQDEHPPEPWFYNLFSAGPSPDRDARGVCVSARLRAITTLLIVIRVVVSALRGDIKQSENAIFDKEAGLCLLYRRFSLSRGLVRS